MMNEDAGSGISEEDVGTVKDRIVAAYALRCTSEADLATFTEYLEQYTTELVQVTTLNILAYLGITEGVEVEVVHLTPEQREKLQASGMLEDYLSDRDKEDFDG